MAALILCSAVLFYFSFPNIIFVEGASFLAWGCALSFFYVLETKLQARVLAGLAWGVVSNALLISWLMPVSLGGWVILVLALATQGVFFAIFFPSVHRPVLIKLFLIPSAWVASEWLRSFFLGGFTWSAGYSQALVPPLIQPAAFGGVYAVAWVLIFGNAAVYLMWRSSRERKLIWILAGVLFTAVLAGGVARLAAHPLTQASVMRVAAVQANIVKEEKTRSDLYDANAARHVALTEKVVLAGKLGTEDLVVWPETAFTDDIMLDEKWRLRLEHEAGRLGVNMLIGSAVLRQGNDLNSALLLSSDRRWRGVYHKMQLVPFAEYTPSGFEPFAQALRIGRYHFQAGDHVGAMEISGGERFGVVICSEEFYPGMFRALSAPGPAFVTVMLNDGWFVQKEALALHALLAPIRAVEAGVSVVRAANTGKTCAFDAMGRQIGRSLDVQRPDAGIYDIYRGDFAGKTIYAKWGDLFFFLCLAFVIIDRLLDHRQRFVKDLRHAV